jgi:para-nitrobenzyl esterase
MAVKLAIAAVAGTLAILTLAATALAGVIPTDKGPVRGTSTSQVNEYLGIPYAKPPVGDLRWRPPKPVARWQGPRDATSFGPHCAQNESPFGSASTSEDCLYLNVFTPGGNGKGHNKDLPVMVWFHGGGLIVGESDDYDPTRLVSQGRVVVTANYRIGYLGFLAHPSLTAETGTSGNYGLLDQQAILRWVQRNIAKFGGNADNVTIFGESAGGLSVHAQLASPLAAGLFDRAVVESGAYELRQPSLATAESRGETTASTLGCSDQTAACLRSVPVETVLANQPTTTGIIGLTRDGRVLPQSIIDAFQGGQFNHVPVVEGTNHDEFALFAYTNIEASFGSFVWQPFLYPILVQTLVQALGLPTTPQDVIAEYPLPSGETSSAPNVIAIGTDALFACPGRRAALALSQSTPTFDYEFNDPDAPQPFVPPASFDYKAFHAGELAYLFDSNTLGGHAPFTTDQEALAAAMVRYWTRFAEQGDPNGPGTPQWPAFSAANEAVQSLQPPTPTTVTNFASDHHCAFWDSL